MLNLIVCIDKFNSIGINNNLIYKFKEDLKIFKQKTINNTVVMGRKTFESIGSKILPNRKNIILSKELKEPLDKSYLVIQDIENVLKISKEENVFIIGGKQIYEYFNLLYDELHITVIKDEFTKQYDLNNSIKLNLNLDNFVLISKKDFKEFEIRIYKRTTSI